MVLARGLPLLSGLVNSGQSGRWARTMRWGLGTDGSMLMALGDDGRALSLPEGVAMGPPSQTKSGSLEHSLP